jgi:fluoroquinolone transport system permease protein
MLRSFSMFVRQIAGDSMLYAALAAPLLAGCAFRFGVPRLEALLCASLGRASILADYYLLFDLFLAMMTPYLFCFASCMVMLAEQDENIASYLAVTPIGRRGYILSRLGLPALLSVAASCLVMRFFALTEWTTSGILLVSLLGSMLCLPVSLLIVSFSHNRVEGMALAKLSGIILLGLPAPFFLLSGAQYLFSVLPSFWVAKLCIQGNYLFAAPAVFLSIIWSLAFFAKFMRKLI